MPDWMLDALTGHEETLVDDWIKVLENSSSFRQDLIRAQELRELSRQFVQILHQTLKETRSADIETEAWQAMRRYMSDLSKDWVQLGFEPSDVAGFMMLLKEPLLNLYREKYRSGDRDDLIDHIIQMNRLVDHLGLWIAQAFQTDQQRIIDRQRDELMELSTPVVTLWEGVLALPLIGTLDSSRTQIVLEALLEQIVEHGANIAILDITGVPTVDTMVAQHLIKAVTAAQLMGTRCIISGIRPTIAQTMVQLGIDLEGVTTKSTLADAFDLALRLRGLGIGPAAAQSSRPELLA